jgi:hypothetical protein
MQLRNRTTDVMIYDRLLMADSWLRRSVGLIGNNQKSGMYLFTRFGVHSFGMKQTLVIVICDTNWMVRQISLLRPWRVVFWNPTWSHVIELPKGEYPVTVGDTVSLDDLS